MAQHASDDHSTSQAPTVSHDAVFKASAPVPNDVPVVSGIDFDTHRSNKTNITAADLVSSMAHMGYQATAVSEAARIINDMKDWRDPSTGAKTTIFLGFTSNLVSSGLRSTLRYLVQHSYVSAIVTTAGGIEEDIIKCLAPTYMSSFNAPGASLREAGMNRIGNLMVPNHNYGVFEDWVVPVLDTMLAEQVADHKKLATDPDRVVQEGLYWTPSAITARLGKEINDESSILYWAYKNDIPIFCPAITDGSLGDMMHFHSFKCSPNKLLIEIGQDVRRINEFARRAERAGMIILGGGLVKHHIANACLHRDGAESAVYINTAQEFDGSDAGARPDEAVSWGKIKAGAESVKVFAEATVVFPLIVAATFAKVEEEVKPDKEGIFS